VRWRNEKWDGSLNRDADLVLLDRDDAGAWLWIARGTTIRRPKGSYPHPCDAVVFVPAHGRWAATWLFDFEPALYVDVTDRVVFDGDLISSVDVDLDVIRHCDGSVRLLDEDEFAHNTAALGYPADLIDRARSTATELVEAVSSHQPPFTPLPDRADIVDAIASLRTEAEPFADWMRAPNIAGHTDVYELENEAIARDGRLDAALHRLAPWDDLDLLDIGCGTGFWLTHYGALARRVVGVEPDPTLLALARERTAGCTNVEVLPGSAERLPFDDESFDIAHARFAYFFGPGAEAGLDEVARVLRPGGVLLVVDNSWRGGEFAELLHASDAGNAVFDPNETDRWWADRGAVRHEVAGGWRATSPDELERILRIEFAAEVVDGFVTRRPPSAELDYRYAVFEWRR